MFWVYMLRCGDGSYYVGHTDNLENRLEQHHLKIYPKCYTATRLPIELVFSQEYPNIKQAYKVEIKLKKMKRRDYIEKIIAEGKIKMSI